MLSFHIETTSKCTLECPLCDRTWFFNKFKKRKIHEIDVDHLVSFVPRGSDILLCGNNGDPIYHSDFHRLCAKLKEKKCRIRITTNGSFRDRDWWASLAKVLDKKDIIKFSIDGLEDTNHIYRKNSDWDSIMHAISILRSHKIRLVWKFIVFKHNQHQIQDARNLSSNLGFERFVLEKSDRWLESDNMMPEAKYVDKFFEHQKKVLSDNEYRSEMKPKCLKDGAPTNDLFIDSEGDFYPCCWMGTYRYRYKSLFSGKYKKFNIANTKIETILQQEKVKQFFISTKNFKNAHECCKIQCGVNNG